jgi:phosphoenolpyruvate carboxylase
MLQRMHTEWPFFQGFVSAIQMSLSKADMPIASEYARLCKDPVTERLVYDLIKQEYDLTESQLLVTIQVSYLVNFVASQPGND